MPQQHVSVMLEHSMIAGLRCVSNAREKCLVVLSATQSQSVQSVIQPTPSNLMQQQILVVAFLQQYSFPHQKLAVPV